MLRTVSRTALIGWPVVAEPHGFGAHRVSGGAPLMAATTTRHPRQPHTQRDPRMAQRAGADPRRRRIGNHLRADDRAAPNRRATIRRRGPGTPGPRAHQWRCSSLFSLGSGFAIACHHYPRVGALNCENHSQSMMCDGSLTAVWCCRKTSRLQTDTCPGLAQRLAGTK